MWRQVLRAKIHRATVTGADLNYEGSLTVDRDLLDASGILVHEKVHVVNLNNGSRAETYVIPGRRGSGEIIMNGAIARLAQIGDLVIILSYGFAEEEDARKCRPTIVTVDAKNRIKKTSGPKSKGGPC